MYIRVFRQFSKLSGKALANRDVWTVDDKRIKGKAVSNHVTVAVGCEKLQTGLKVVQFHLRNNLISPCPAHFFCKLDFFLLIGFFFCAFFVKKSSK